MDRVNQLRGCAGGSGDSSLESSPGSEGYLTANDSSKFYSLSEVDSSLEVAPDKDVSLSSAADSTISASDQFADLSPISKKSDLLDSYKIGKHIEAANILSGGVDIFDDDNDTSCDGNELIIDDNVGDSDDKSNELKIVEEEEKADDSIVDATLADAEPIPSKDTEVSLQIDGKNVDAIDIGNGLYLYRKGDLQKELAAVQIIDTDQQQPSFKFLKVRENAEGNLEVYEEIEVEVPKTAPQKLKPQQVKTGDSHVPIKDIKNVINDPTNQNVARKISSPPKNDKNFVSLPGCSKTKEIITPEVKTDVKTITTEAKISPLLGFHSTPNKEGIPLTKTMVDQQLHPNRHSDNVKKTIEVNTDSCKPKLQESSVVDATDKAENSPDNTTNKDSSSSIDGNNTELAKVSPLSVVEKDQPTKVTEGQKATTPPKQTVDENTSSANNKVAKILDFTSPKKTVTAEATSTTTLKTCSDNFYSKSNADKTLTNPKTINLVVKPVNNQSKITNEPLVSKPVDQKSPVKPELNHNKDNIQNPKTKQTDVYNSSEFDKSVLEPPERTQSATNHITKEITSPTKPLEAAKSLVKPLEAATSHVKTLEAAISHVKPLEAATSHVKPLEAATIHVKTLEAAKSHVKPLEAATSHVKNLEAAISHVKPLEAATSHVKNLEAAISHVKPLEASQSHVKPLKADISHVKPLAAASSHVKPSEAAMSHVTPFKATISNVKPLEATISHVKPLEAAISHVKPLEATISHVKPLEGSISLVKPLEGSITHVKPLGADISPKMFKATNENKSFSETTAAPKATAFTTSPKTHIPSQSNKTKEDLKEIHTVDTTEEIDEKNTSDDLIQLNDLGVVTEKKLLDYVEPIESVNDITKSPIKFDKNINDTKILIDTKTKEAPKPFVAAHTISSIPLPLFTKIEQKPYPSISESKPKPLDKNALVNKYVNKALLIKSVTSGPVGDHKFGINKPAATSTATLLDARGLNLTTKKEIPKAAPVDTKPKSINNNNAVPFGKWTEANKQAYLNKIKETKVVTNPNTNQIKQPYDLNRRDVLKKIDSQRQQVSAHSHAARTLEQNKMTVKKETPMFVQKSTLKPDTKPPVKLEPPKPKPEFKPAQRRDIPETVTQPRPNEPSGSRKDKRTDFHNQDIINRTIEDILMDRKSPNELHVESKPVERPKIVEKQYNRAPTKSMGLVDDIEKKMNELHGIPHERLQESRYNHDMKTYTKPKPYEYDSKSYLASRGNKIPSLVPIRPTPKFATIDVDEEEVLEHPPVTGDMELKRASPLKAHAAGPAATVTAAAKKDGGISEKDFEKFARRNSITYNDNCIAVNYDTKQPHVVEDVVLTKYTIGSSSKSAFHQHVPTNLSTQNHSSKFMPIRSDDGLKSCQSNKVQMAYNSALTAMRQKESPITVIEDKPVKVVYMEPNAEYVPSRLNVQGKELSPAKKPLIPESDASTHSSCDSLDGEVLGVVEAAKSPEKSRTQQPQKHQRKQVLTPVDVPDMELVAASELTSPKKKRKIEEAKTNNSESSSKSVLPKKTYLLGRNAAEEVRAEPQMPPETVPMSAASAIDNLVKAAEMLENQSKNMQMNTSTPQDVPETPTPVKRGRGRPRKNPLPDVSTSIQTKSMSASPQKKPRVSKQKSVTSSEESSDDDEALVNWSMGKINENIVCPICNKLFRTENVVFKHVKHCTGPSPSRSDTNTRSSRRTRQSYDSMQDITDSNDSFDKIPEKKKNDSEKNSETKKDDRSSEKDKSEIKKKVDKPKSNADAVPKEASEQASEDAKIKNKDDKPEDSKNAETKSSATKVKQKPTLKSNLVCEICNKSFRQLSYLVSHKMTHKKDEPKKAESSATSSVFSCEVCKKEFRKLHHLVQHRLIHTSTSRSRRKSSADTLDRNTKDKPEDPSAGFRCEPCDKSFRKLHHLVEHRETHDGINRQKTTSAPVVPEKDKTEPPPPQCNICNKTFRKLHHLIEHKEQHVEVSSEKSDDKSVKSSLSTRDIIHECSLCYMVFPNEHSLNKHSVNCQKKKRQSISKPSKVDEDSGDDIALSKIAEVAKAEEKLVKEKFEEKPVQQLEVKPAEAKPAEVVETKDKEPEPKPAEPAVTAEVPKAKKTETKPEQKIIETIVIEDTPKKKESKAPKDKLPATVTKRQKSTNLELPVIEESKPCSDDDEVRYMLNPNFKADDQEGKFFMKVRANKRNSLQIERPNSKNLITRRVSLQNPPKIPRLKPKKIEVKEVVKPLKTEVPSTDSDDSDVKYSFPEAPKEEVKTKVEKVKRKTIADKRKSLSGIAKRKSLGKSIVSKSAAKSIPVPKTARKRISEIEHRCDCGQLFSSAALLTRHTSLAHTPPRLRRARKSPTPTQPARKSTKPEPKPRKSETQTEPKPAKKPEEVPPKKPEPTRRKSDRQAEPKTVKKSEPEKNTSKEETLAKAAVTRKSSTRSDTTKSGANSRKSSVNIDKTKDEATPSKRPKKDTDTATKSQSRAKLRRTATHAGVPVPDKMRKLFEKLKK